LRSFDPRKGYCPLDIEHVISIYNVIQTGPAFAHGITGAKQTLGAPPPMHKNLQKTSEALQYCDSNEFTELTEGTLCVLMSKGATNNICSNKHKE
jgi:hypothetical protein